MIHVNSLPGNVDDLAPSQVTLSRAVFAIFKSVFDLPAFLYIVVDNELVADEEISNANVTGYCKKMMTLAHDKCCQCHFISAKQAFLESADHLTLCHAGLWNQAAPIIIGGKIEAVILYGQMRLADVDRDQYGSKRHGQIGELLGIGTLDVEALCELYQAVRPVPSDRFGDLNAALQRLTDAIDLEHRRAERAIMRVAHDLNTRMTAVIAHAENMQIQSLARRDVQLMAKAVLQEVIALATTVDTAGNLLGEYFFKDEPIEPMLLRARDVYSAEASRNGVAFQMKLSAQPWPKLRLSRAHMQLAINNLVHNALKYSHRPAIPEARFVQIDCKQLPAGAIVTITNYGVGILPKERELIFERGYQGALTKGEHRSGSGNGLSFVKQIMHAHNGQVSVESRRMGNDDRGPYLNRFEISIPASS